MHSDSHPILRTMKIADLRPTQALIGQREVLRKREALRQLGSHAEGVFLGRHMIPVVLGPRKRAYIIDNHHLTRALFEEGVQEVLVRPMADFEALGREEFWHVMDCRNWLYLFDACGRAISPSDLPKSVVGLSDCAYRSLAADLRRAGVFAKDMTPYAEFQWADFLRRRIAGKLLRKDYDKALAKAGVLARSQFARHLPGWAGPEG